MLVLSGFDNQCCPGWGENERVCLWPVRTQIPEQRRAGS
jgi:hypothetical protein